MNNWSNIPFLFSNISVWLSSELYIYSSILRVWQNHYHLSLCCFNRRVRVTWKQKRQTTHSSLICWGWISDVPALSCPSALSLNEWRVRTIHIPMVLTYASRLMMFASLAAHLSLPSLKWVNDVALILPRRDLFIAWRRLYPLQLLMSTKCAVGHPQAAPFSL